MVLRLTLDRQLKLLSIKTGWENERRPFTFTCLPSDTFLEFTIKTYPVRKGVTNELLKLNLNDELSSRGFWYDNIQGTRHLYRWRRWSHTLYFDIEVPLIPEMRSETINSSSRTKHKRILILQEEFKQNAN